MTITNRSMLGVLAGLLAYTPEQGKHRRGRTSTLTSKERKHRKTRRRLAKQGRRAARMYR